MFKALVKTRIQMMLAAMFRSGKKGKQRSKAGIAGYGLLMLYVAVVFFFLFYMMASQLCSPLLEAGLGWLYFALTGIMATALGVVGSVFTAQTQLFEARDNELLLAMPIPPSHILGSRMLALYGQNFLLEAVVLLPALLVYLREASPSPLSIILFVLLLFLLPLLALTLSCVLGWLVALISSRMRNKSLITMLLSLGFLAAYFYLYSRMNDYLQLLILNSEAVGETVRQVLFPLYQMGLAAQGNPVAFAWFVLCTLIPFGAVYWVLSRSFLRIVTAKRGAAKIRYEEKPLRVSSPNRALLQKELRHFWASPAYMLNGALGSVFLLIGTVLAAVKGGWLVRYLGQIPGFEAWLPLVGCTCVCMVAAMNVITAPSVSLEGKNLWMLQSLPLTGWQVLRSKLRLHLLVTAIPSFLCAAALDLLLRPEPLMFVMMLAAPLVFSLLCGVLGLVINLLMPRLDWVNETSAVKQSGSVILAMFADWGVVLVFAALFLILRRAVGVGLFVLICTVLMAVVCWCLLHWLKGRGSEIFETLNG